MKCAQHAGHQFSLQIKAPLLVRLLGIALLTSACASSTIATKNFKTPGVVYKSICIEEPQRAALIDMTVGERISVSENSKKEAEAQLHKDVAFYKANANKYFIAALSQHGIAASACALTGETRPRLSTFIHRAYFRKAPMGMNTVLGIQAVLREGPNRELMWQGEFRAGSDMLLAPLSERDIDSLADQVLSELGSSGWIKLRH